MKEPTSLPDLQLSRDERGIELDAVGVTKLVLPLKLVDALGNVQSVPATWEATVSLAAELRGTHMSRFVSSLEEFGQEPLRTLDLSLLAKDLRRRLQSRNLRLSMGFSYFMRKVSPATEAVSSMNVPCELVVEDTEGSAAPSHTLSLELTASNLCPCSKAIADFGAHNQRVFIRASVGLVSPQLWDAPCLENLVSELETSASSPIFPLLKRADEKAVTEQQYINPKFVEDVTRDAALQLRGNKGVSGFSLEVEALESIHSHNAVARLFVS